MAYMLSRPHVSTFIVLKNASLSHDNVKHYAIDEDFKDVYERLTHGSQVENYHLQDKLLYHVGKLCIHTSERVHVI